MLADNTMERVLPLVIVLVLAASAASASNDDVLGLLRTLIEVDSTSGSERAVADVIAARLELGNWTVVRQAVEGGDGTRQNLLALRAGATAADVRVLFSTHMDTVPPYIAFREDATTVFGRGASDAKGPLAAMVTALDALLVSGHLGPAQERALGLLFVVGEEVDHSGMIRANDLGLAGLRYLVNGEPTESTMARGHKGGYKFDLETHGRAAHSGYPELGDSAIIPLIETALDLSRVALPVHPDLGPTTLNVGLIHGGVAANVVPDFATAEVMVRVATSVAETERLVQAVRKRKEEARKAATIVLKPRP